MICILSEFVLRSFNFACILYTNLCLCLFFQFCVYCILYDYNDFHDFVNKLVRDISCVCVLCLYIDTDHGI